MLPLTKTASHVDLELLPNEVATVKRFAPSEQQRLFEYSMALRFLLSLPEPPQEHVADVGGAGSEFPSILKSLGVETIIIDPKVNCPLHMFVGSRRFPVVFSISTIEHVDDPEEFARDLAAITQPGGYLFLTTDIWGREEGEPDTAHFNWMRKRIYTIRSWIALSNLFYKEGFTLFGGADWSYQGDTVYSSYSFASLGLRKED